MWVHIFLKRFSLLEELIKICAAVHVNFQLLLPILMKFEFSGKIFVK
jgi:hypothetical protein